MPKINIHIQSLKRSTLQFFLAITLRSAFIYCSSISFKAKGSFSASLNKMKKERVKVKKKLTFHFRNIILIIIFKFEEFKDNILKQVRRYTYKKKQLFCNCFAFVLFMSLSKPLNDQMLYFLINVISFKTSTRFIIFSQCQVVEAGNEYHVTLTYNSYQMPIIGIMYERSVEFVCLLNDITLYSKENIIVKLIPIQTCILFVIFS